MTAADEIRRRGWRQCSIAADPLRERLLREDLLRDVTADDLLIVATQDCDLVCHSFETEPYAEIVIGRRVDTADGNCRFGKNPRRLQFELSGTPDTYEVQAISRISVPRDVLAEYGPDPERKLDETTSRMIPEWLGKRYTRVALPDSFNERSRVAQAKIRDRLKADGELVEAIFLTVVPNAELAPHEAYSLVVRVVVREETLLDDARGAPAESGGPHEGSLSAMQGHYARRLRGGI
ncbi:MAG: hypothetical protein AABO58_05790 [Acidobacteriota bacterium]